MDINPMAVTVSVPGLGSGWTRVADALVKRINPRDIERIWLFPVIRREEREWGVAVVACCTDEERRKIFTASYMTVVRGREKGHGKVAVEEVGESPATVLEDVLKGVRERTGEVEPPAEIEPSLWFGDHLNESNGEGSASKNASLAAEAVGGMVEGTR